MGEARLEWPSSLGRTTPYPCAPPHQGAKSRRVEERFGKMTVCYSESESEHDSVVRPVFFRSTF